MMSKYTLFVGLRNEAGALERVLGVLRRRAINIDSLTLSRESGEIYSVVMSVTDEVVQAGSDRIVKELSSLFVVATAEHLEDS